MIDSRSQDARRRRFARVGDWLVARSGWGSNARLGFWAGWALLLTGPLVGGAFGGFPRVLTGLVLLTVLAMAVVSRWAGGWVGVRFGWGDWAMVLFLIWMGGSYLMAGAYSEYPLAPLAIGGGVVLFWAGRSVVGQSAPDRVVIGLFTGVAALWVVQAVLGLIQVRRPEFLMPEIVHPGRVSGLLDNPNQFGGGLILGLSLAVGLVVIRRVPLWLRVLAVVGGVVMAAALIHSYSRGAVTGLVAALPVVLAIHWAGRRKWVAMALAGLVVVGLTAQAAWVAARFYGQHLDSAIAAPGRKVLLAVLSGNDEPSSIARRYYDFNRNGSLDGPDLVLAANMAREWRPHARNPGRKVTPDRPLERLAARFDPIQEAFNVNDAARFLAVLSCFEIWRDHPLWGAGPGNFLRHSRDYIFYQDNDLLVGSHAHCLPMHMLAELGVPGLLGVGGLFLVTGWGVWRGGREGETWRLFIGWGAMAVLLHNLVDTTVWYVPLKYTLPLLWAVLLTPAGCCPAIPRRPAEAETHH